MCSFWVIPHFSNYASEILIFFSSFSYVSYFSSISIICLFLPCDVLNARKPWGRVLTTTKELFPDGCFGPLWVVLNHVG